MSQKLRDYPAELLALAQLVADHFSISAVYAEKDFCLTEAFRATVDAATGDALKGLHLKWR